MFLELNYFFLYILIILLGIFIDASCKHVDMFAKLDYIAMFYISINEMNECHLFDNHNSEFYYSFEKRSN